MVGTFNHHSCGFESYFHRNHLSLLLNYGIKRVPVTTTR